MPHSYTTKIRGEEKCDCHVCIGMRCAGCGHSEFIHSYKDPRNCMFHQCRCGQFIAPRPS